jgi:N-acylneuraminate cytidylyltransferase
MNQNSIAIITARGGSKRIPKKNIKEFCGKPIIAYSIEAALQSGLFSEVMVSTDSTEIAEIAKAYGASVPFLRSAKTSDDFATTSDVLMEVLENYKELGKEFQYMCCIYPTAPFVTAQKLQAAMELMKAEEPVSVLPVVSFSYPPQRCFVIDESQHMEYKFKEHYRSRSQDLEKWYHDTGQFYMYHVGKYLERNGVITEGIMPIIVPELEVQDIDTEVDWKLAELKYQMMIEK